MEVKIWNLCSVSSTLSHANLEQPFRTLAIKWEVNIFVKKTSRVFLHASFIPASFCVRLSLLLCRCDAEWWCRWLYNTFCTLTNKVRGKYICLRSLPACVCLCHCALIIVSLWCCRWRYNTCRLYAYAYLYGIRVRYKCRLHMYT